MCYERGHETQTMKPVLVIPPERASWDDVPFEIWMEDVEKNLTSEGYEYSDDMVCTEISTIKSSVVEGIDHRCDKSATKPVKGPRPKVKYVRRYLPTKARTT